MTVEALSRFLATEEGNGCFQLWNPNGKDIEWFLKSGLIWEEIAIVNFSPFSSEVAYATYQGLLRKGWTAFYNEIRSNVPYYERDTRTGYVQAGYFITFWLKR